MTYETKMARVRALIEAFNASANTAAARIDVKVFENQLQQIGASSDETLALVSWEDLQECGLPRLLAKQVAEELRVKPTEDTYVSQKKVDRMRYEELIERYNPREDDLVAKKLQELSKGKRFIVFSDTNLTVDQQATLRIFTEIRRGFGEVALTTDSQGRPARIYKVGDVPNDELDENPLYPGRALRTDESCDQTLRSWKGIPLYIRQVFYLAITDTHEARISTISDAHNLLDLAVATQGESGSSIAVSKIGQRFPRAHIRFSELSAGGTLPRLKIKTTGVSGGSHPFYQEATT